MQYHEKLKQIWDRDYQTFLYHKTHPRAKLCNARDRAAGYHSRQAVWLAIRRIKRGLQD